MQEGKIKAILGKIYNFTQNYALFIFTYVSKNLFLEIHNRAAFSANDILPTVTEINFYPCPQTAGNHIEETTPAPHCTDPLC